ncbi:MipA/OmpV family protein [Gilvimarinus chinensis]|uniref:MipA/OmpV family protein n=1 Tax=Gilvimarinus chinensis TaxID=396005 RepID=UPI00036BE88B|nr:MipA/OmpV family protein [Gilvimarinus chinensis]
MKRFYILALCLIPALAQSTEETAEKRWELGIGVGGIYAPDYKGSKSYRDYVAPIPYVVYRGPVIRTDRDGVRGDFLRTNAYEFTASMAVSVTPDSDKNALREGMPELTSTLELGPAVNVNLSGEDFSQGLSLTLPVRAVVALGDGSPDYIGLVSAPSVVHRGSFKGGWKSTLRAGPVFASGKYHDYYYSVAPKYALPDRPEYNASSGYNGFNLQGALSRRFSDYWYAFYIRYSNIQGVNFDDSPLVETEHNVSGGFAISWVFL